MKNRILLLIGICMLANGGALRAQNEEKSLLWRISGNGMQKPSYLFGTFHVRTRKLFAFPDSLYTAIDNTEVFALELNLDSLNNGIAAYMGDLMENGPATSTPKKKEKKIKELLTPEELKELKAFIADNTDLDPDELTPKQLYLMKDKLMKHTARADDMSTFMDAFLYTVACDKGKVIGGLEHFSDQMALINNPELTEADPKKILQFFKQGSSAEDQMMELYLKKDLPEIGKIAAMYTPGAEEALLTSRNKVMLRSMDSIMKLHSLFAAVGTLHLPGPKGLIALLRQKGYTVQPVFCATTTDGATYHFKNAKGWVTVVNEEDGFSVRMPGYPSAMDAGGAMPLKSYFDIQNAKYYMLGRIPRPEGSRASSESVIRAMQKSIIKGQSKDVEMKDIQKAGMDGKEYFFSDGDGNHARLQLFGNDNGVYLLMSTSNKTESSGVDSFFSSFRLLQAATPAVVAPAPAADEPDTKISNLIKAPGVLWSNRYDVNFSIPQQVSFSSDSKYFAMGYSGGNVTVFDAANGDVFTSYHLNSGHVYCTAFQPGGHLLATGDGDGYMVIYNYVTGTEIKTVAAHDKTMTAITFSKDGTLLITGGKDKTIKIWDPKTGNLIKTIDDVTGKIQALRITDDNKTIIAGTTTLTNGLRTFSASSGAEIRAIESANLQLFDLSPDSRYVATANLNKNVLVYDIKKLSPPKHLHGHHSWMTDVVFSPTGKILYSASEDRTVIAWNTLHFTPMGVVFEADKKIGSIAVSPDGHYLAVMDERGVFSILDISGMEKGF